MNVTLYVRAGPHMGVYFYADATAAIEAARRLMPLLAPVVQHAILCRDQELVADLRVSGLSGVSEAVVTL